MEEEEQEKEIIIDLVTSVLDIPFSFELSDACKFAKKIAKEEKKLFGETDTESDDSESDVDSEEDE